MHPTWTEQWWPIAYLQDLNRSKPNRFTLLERDLVIWWDTSGEVSRWRVFPDICPHRLVPLSEGRINSNGFLECPYHGWSFDGQGHCRSIPQAAKNTKSESRRSRCTSLPAATGQGLLFVWMGAPETANPQRLPLVPILKEDPNSWTVQDTFRDLPMDAVTLLENVLDVSHIPFTHHKTVGKRENAAPVEATITSEDKDGFDIFWEEGPRRGKLGSQSTRFQAPQLMWHDLTAKGFGRILTIVYAVPIRRGQCRLFARFPFQFQSAALRVLIGLRPRWLQHIGNHKVIEDDQVFLHWQERALENAGGSPAAERAFYMPNTADVYVTALHRWLDSHGGEPFAGKPLPERQQTTALMDRFHSHTKICISCSSALRRIRTTRPWVWGFLWGSSALIGLGQGNQWSAIGLVVAVTAGITLRQLFKWELGLTTGSGKAPRNH
ncbi:Rieske 2Fe-2S domain-containing protein [Synechococcus sp. M16CYN]|uniref:aromatic ring-hydroxylating dioxygenase subunit alpha n=1 Tax=Synechococcus sp. M16CYN TaxID=3103139 RepID=UPI003251ADDA